ncbi:MAG: glycoside hydrolase family 2 TIM barrel-domain containing protein [Bacteroidota bacterium]
MKQHLFTYLLLILVLGVISGCENIPEKTYLPFDAPFTKTVEIRKEGDDFQLFRHGKAFFIKGGAGRSHLAELKAAGGNSIRTWNTDNIRPVLDAADSLDIAVTVGLYVQPQRQGFDYNDMEARKQQQDSLIRIVNTYKDHPAVLMWAIGNELTLRGNNSKVWDAVNEIAAEIHEVDPNHPTTTMIMPKSKTTTDIAKRAPNIDILSLNVFGVLGKIPKRIRYFFWNWDGPYLISEWGPRGWWEAYDTDWLAPVEGSTKVKAKFCHQRYQACMAKDTARCMGSYVFYWGQKQERTHTWFSMFLETGEKTGLVDQMHFEWTGNWPENMCPEIQNIRLNGLQTFENIYLEPGKSYEAYIEVEDRESDSLSFVWHLEPEGNYAGMTGGDKETRPDSIPGMLQHALQAKTTLTVPEKTGAYRLFITVRDGQGGAATANAPFYVIDNRLY